MGVGRRCPAGQDGSLRAQARGSDVRRVRENMQEEGKRAGLWGPASDAQVPGSGSWASGEGEGTGKQSEGSPCVVVRRWWQEGCSGQLAAGSWCIAGGGEAGGAGVRGRASIPRAGEGVGGEA